MSPSSEQLEHEAELNRVQLAETLDELRSRITPGQVMDQLLDYSRESGAGDLVRNLGRQVRDNPLPLTLMGASLAWLMLGNGRAPNGRGGSSGYGRVRGAAAGAYAGARDTASDYAAAAQNTAADYAGSLSDSASEYAQSARDTASEYAGAAGDAARRFGESASDAASQAANSTRRFAATAGAMGQSAASGLSSAAQALGDSATSVGRSTSEMGRSALGAGRSFVDFCCDQPVVLGAIGLAIGAALGAAFPTTESENRLMGETSDNLKEQASDLASEQYDKAKSVVQAAASEAKHEVERQDLFPSAERETETGTHGEAAKEHAGSEDHGEGHHLETGHAADEHAGTGERAPGIAPLDEHHAEGEGPVNVTEHPHGQRP